MRYLHNSILTHLTSSSGIQWHH